MNKTAMEAPDRDAEFALARRIRRAIHRHPELGHHEHRTAAYIERVLTLLGLRPFRPAPTSVAVVIGRPDQHPAVGFRADLDALRITETTGAPYTSRVPGIMHACGHDGHAAALLLLARRLVAATDRPSAALLVFQQGEEAHPSGAPQVLRGLPEHVLPPQFYAIHLWPELTAGMIGVRNGPLLAAVAGVELQITGREGRAHGTQTETGGIDAIAVGIRLYIALAPNGTGRNLDDAQRSTLSIGRISGGERPNRTPSRCLLHGTVRALSWTDQDAAVERIRHVAAAVALESNAQIDVIVESGIRPPVVNSTEAAQRVIDACRATATPWCRYPDAPVGVSDDFGWYTNDRQGALVMLGCGEGPGHPDLHTPTFDFDESVLQVAVDVFEALAK